MKKRSTVLDLLNKLIIKPDNVVVLSNKIPVPVDDELKDKQEITIIQVFSGG